MKEYFLPVDYQQQFYMKYQNCSEGNYSVDKYMKDFYRLYSRNNMKEPQFRTVTKYIGELKQELQDEIVVVIWDMGTFVARAKKLEEWQQRAISRAQQRQFIGVQKRPNSVGIENKQKTSPGSSQVQQKVQQQSRQQPPKQQQPLRQQNNPYAKPMPRKCFKYKEPGYISNDCCSKNLNLVKAEVGEA